MGSKGLSSQVTSGEQANANALVAIASQQQANSQQLFNAAFPGFQSAENFESTLSTGDPYAIARAIAPASAQIAQQSASSKANILNTAPSGGEKNLALEQVSANQGNALSNLASQSYLNSFNALAQLAGQGVGQSISAAGTGISGYGTASQTLGQLGNQQIQQKGAHLSAIGDLVGDITSLGTAGIFGGAGKGGGGGTAALDPWTQMAASAGVS